MSTGSDNTLGNNPTRMLKVGDSIRSKRHRGFPFTLLNRYEVQALLGSGGMGDVTLARDCDLGRLVAIKWIRGDLLQSPQASQRFFQEAQAAAALNHANIVQIYDRGSDEGDEFFVMEYVDGESLDALLKRGPLDMDQCIRITIAICDALQAAHDHGIVHRDVKPANIIQTSDGIPKLTDFGVARRGGEIELTLAGSTLGTPIYMAPEQAKNALNASSKSDQYSLVATLYHMLTGESPARILERRLPDMLRDVVVRGTEPDPEQRFPTMSDFKVALLDATGASVAMVSSGHAMGNAVDTLKRQKERVRKIHGAARRLAFEQHDWLLARTTLQQIPESVRDEKLWEDVCDKAELVDSLDRSINEAVAQMQWKGLNLAIDELLALQPQRADLKQLKDQLDDSDSLCCSSLSASSNEEMLREIQKRHPGLRCLSVHLETISLRIAVEELIALGMKDLRLEMLEPLGAYLRSNDTATRSLAEALYERVLRLSADAVLAEGNAWKHRSILVGSCPDLTGSDGFSDFLVRKSRYDFLIGAALFFGCFGVLGIVVGVIAIYDKEEGAVIVFLGSVVWVIFFAWLCQLGANRRSLRRPLEQRLRYQYPKDPLTPEELEKRKEFVWWQAPFSYPPSS